MSVDAPRQAFACETDAQYVAYSSWAPEVGFSGRLHAFKTRSILEAADYDARTWANNRIAACRLHAKHLFSSSYQQFMDEVLSPAERKWERKSGVGGTRTVYPNGSVIWWFGLDDPGAALSAEYASAYVDQAEQLNEQQANTIKYRTQRIIRPPAFQSGRLLPLRSRVVWTFNPDADFHWANVRFGFKQMQERGEYERIIRTKVAARIGSRVIPAGKIIGHAIIAQADDGMSRMTEAYALGMATSTGAWHDRYVLGKWGTFEGQVLPNYHEPTHVLDAPPAEWGWDAWGGFPPPTWKRRRVADFGFAPDHPFVMLWIARVPPECTRYPLASVVYREIHMSQRIVPVHKAEALRMDAEELEALNRGIERWNQANPSQPRALLRRLSFSQQVCDHDAGDRAIMDSGPDRIIMDPAIKDRVPGAQAVVEQLALYENPHTHEREPRLLFMRHALREVDVEIERLGRPTCVWQELPGLRWKKAGTNSEQAPKEDWVKDRDDGFDALRYDLLTYKDRGDFTIHSMDTTSPNADDD